MARAPLPLLEVTDEDADVERAELEPASTVPTGHRWRLSDGRIDLLSLDDEGLRAWLAERGEKAFRARQIFRWLHDKQVASFEEMTDLKKAFRADLQQEAAIASPEVTDVKVSSDGTRKYQLTTWDEHIVEAVFIPNVSGEGKNALCISSQVGCAMGCTFCATASLKLKRHLSPGEIVGQYHAVCRDLRAAGIATERVIDDDTQPRIISNIVYMGMGEPLHNYQGVVGSIRLLTHEEGPFLAPKRITVSTSGLVPAIRRLGQDTDVHIAISLNGSHNEGRVRVMPVNKRYDLEALIGVCKEFPLKRHRRITFEYVMLEGENDSDDDARRVVKLLRGIPTKVNLIPFNAHPLSSFRRPSDERVTAFQRILHDGGLNAFVRTTRGDDIDAACGMLGAKKLEQARAGGGAAPQGE
jgi:23S rRNA (adenine2503-C2)-methyltransferase